MTAIDCYKIADAKAHKTPMLNMPLYYAWYSLRVANSIKMAKVINAILMSQVAGVSLDTILNRGQQIRTVALMLAKMKCLFKILK